MEANNVCEDSLIVAIQDDVEKYIKRHRKMPISYAVTRSQMKHLKELRQQGKEPKVTFKGEEYLVPVGEMRGL